jgi:hypothetical protein
MSVWCARSLIVLAACVALLIGVPICNENIRRADLILESPAQVEATVIDKRTFHTKSGDNYSIVYKVQTSSGQVSGDYSLPAEQWDKVEVGGSVPIWYATKDPSISQRHAPTKDDALHTRHALWFFLGGVCFAALLLLIYLDGSESEERKLATQGVPVLANYKIVRGRLGNNPADAINWSFLDANGQQRTILGAEVFYLSKRFPKPSGVAVIIVQPDEWTNIRPWASFRWVDIVVEELAAHSG